MSACPPQIHAGALIDYTIRWLGIPVRWRSRIVAFEENSRFTDEQVRGPYRRWVHEHAFEPRPEGTLVRDRVSYELPLGPLGSLAHRLVVRRQLEGIFDYRGVRIAEIFGS